MEFGRVQSANVHAHRATAVEVSADVRALLGMRNREGVNSQPLCQRFGATGHFVVLIVTERALEHARQLEVAVDPFCLDEVV